MINGWLFYKKQKVNVYRASNEVYFEEQMIKIFLSNFHHCWMSFEGMSEAYNEAFRQSDCVMMIKNFLVTNQNVGNHFKRSVKGDAADSIDPMYVEEEEENLNDMHEMHRKNLSAVVFNYWVVEELKERNLMGKFLFGPYYLDKEKKHTVTFKDSVEIFLMKIDELRIDETYEHIKCTGASFLLDL